MRFHSSDFVLHIKSFSIFFFSALASATEKFMKREEVKNRKIDNKSLAHSAAVCLDKKCECKTVATPLVYQTQAKEIFLSALRRNNEKSSHALWSRKISDTHKARCIKFVATMKNIFLIRVAVFVED